MTNPFEYEQRFQAVAEILYAAQPPTISQDIAAGHLDLTVTAGVVRISDAGV
jgi:hypothetical protein